MQKFISRLPFNSKSDSKTAVSEKTPIVSTTPSSRTVSKTSSAKPTDAFVSAIKTRRTHYHLTNKSTIPDSRIQELVEDVIKHTPSAFNVQSARAVVLLGDHNRKLWQIGAKQMQKVIPAEQWGYFESKIKGLEGAYGTVLFFEDQDAVEALAQSNPSVAGVVPEWSEHSAGMHHFALWTALTLEGLGANLQHYNMVPPFSAEVAETWNLPKQWKLNAQLVFGTPGSPPGERAYSPLNSRVKVIA